MCLSYVQTQSSIFSTSPPGSQEIIPGWSERSEKPMSPTWSHPNAHTQPPSPPSPVTPTYMPTGPSTTSLLQTIAPTGNPARSPLSSPAAPLQPHSGLRWQLKKPSLDPTQVGKLGLAIFEDLGGSFIYSSVSGWQELDGTSHVESNLFVIERILSSYWQGGF